MGGAGGKPGQNGQAGGAAGGVQVGSMQGTGDSAAGGQNSAPGKPGPIAIGDTGMRIKQADASPGVIGSQVADPMTRPAGAAMGQGSTGPAGDNTNRGSEKGKAMPQGL
jgi:hypothetical protein